MREMVRYQSLVVLWKMTRLSRPQGMSRKFELIKEDKIRTQKARLQIVSTNFKEKVVSNWNELPGGIRKERYLPRFKKSLRSWLISCRNPQ